MTESSPQRPGPPLHYPAPGPPGTSTRGTLYATD
jgi:hypothetical protein